MDLKVDSVIRFKRQQAEILPHVAYASSLRSSSGAPTLPEQKIEQHLMFPRLRTYALGLPIS